MKSTVVKLFILSFVLTVCVFLSACQAGRSIPAMSPKDGADGLNAYELAVQAGFEGTLEEWLSSLKGQDGAVGANAYELAVQEGFEGTLAEWLASLKGADGQEGVDGEDGVDGLSAYELAVQAGFEGTLEDWLASLKGEDGTSDKDENDEGENDEGENDEQGDSAINSGVCALLASSSPNAMPSFSSANKTFQLPLDTLIIDPRLPNGYISITEGCSSVSWEYVTSAVCVFYDIANHSLVALPYNMPPDYSNFILVCVIRNNGLNNHVTCSLPVTMIDEKVNETIEKENDAHLWSNLNVRAVNHRGFNTLAPENTLASYRLAKVNGFTYVECDVRLTSDGVPVLLHDETVDRTSNGTGKISDMTLEEAKALDFGSWKSATYSGETIPTFEEFLLLCKNLGLHPYIKVKTGEDEAVISNLVYLVKRYGMQGKVTWLGGKNSLSLVKAADLKARLGYVTNAFYGDTINILKGLKTDENEVFCDFYYPNLTEEIIAEFIRNDFPVEVWTTNSSQAIVDLDPYITGVTSDHLIAGKVLYEDAMQSTR